MKIDEQTIRAIVTEVVNSLGPSVLEGEAAAPAETEAGMPTSSPRAMDGEPGWAPSKAGVPTGKPGVFPNLDAAVEAATRALGELGRSTLALRREIIQNLRTAACGRQEELARMAVEETGLGRRQDKVLKNRLAALLTPGVEDLTPAAFSDEHGLTLVERAPYGVIGAITPSTNPTETIVNNAIGMIAAGNTVVFNPHPAAKGVSAYTVALLNEAALKAGGPENLVSMVADPSLESAQALMKHPGVALLVVTGGPAVVKAAMASAKKVIAAGPGNPPCVVDETADLAKAGLDIVKGASFDNNIVCICEKEILAVSRIADALKAEMKKHGTFELDPAQTEKLTGLIIAEPGRPGREGAPNKAWVGKDARLIAAQIGLDLPESIRLLLCEVPAEHPLVWTEQLMPVIPLVRTSTVDEAIDLAVACEHGFRHTAVMHSLALDKLSRMAKVMNCSLFVKNGSSFNGMGWGGAGYTSFTIASPTGEGFTRARTFTRERRCSLIDYFRIV